MQYSDFQSDLHRYIETIKIILNSNKHTNGILQMCLYCFCNNILTIKLRACVGARGLVVGVDS